jgi:hypothetical protein
MYIDPFAARSPAPVTKHAPTAQREVADCGETHAMARPQAAKTLPLGELFATARDQRNARARRRGPTRQPRRRRQGTSALMPVAARPMMSFWICEVPS